jgi:putative DNA primase/helicase
MTLWTKCLNEWFETENEKLALQEFFGYLLCPHANYKKALVLVGDSSSGKSVICEIARLIVGNEFTCSISPDEMDDIWSLYPIKNKKLNIVWDTITSNSLVDSGFKRIISGESIRIDGPYTGSEIIVPIVKHIFLMNRIPRIKDSDNLFGRLLVLRMGKVIDIWNQNPGLADSLKEGLSEIIKWSQEGLARLDSNNGKFTTVAYNETDGNFEESPLEEMISNFLNHSNKIELVEDGEIPIHLFKTLFEEFSKIEPVLNVSIGRTMRNLGYKSVAKNNMRWYKGIQVK